MGDDPVLAVDLGPHLPDDQKGPKTEMGGSKQ